MSDVDIDPPCPAYGANHRGIADSSTLARYWNDALPDAVNVDTIAWWLDQAAKSEASSLVGNAELSGSVSATAFPQEIP